MTISRLRILHLIHSLDPHTGGPAEAVRLMGKVQVEAGHIVEAACLDADTNPAYRFDFPVHCFGPAGRAYGYSRRLADWLESSAPDFDVAIVHGLWQYPLHVAYTTLLDKLPYFVYPHGMLDPWFNQTSLLKHLKKSIYWSLLGRKALGAASGVIFTTEEEKDRSATAFPGARWNAMVAPLGIEGPPEDLATFAPLELRRVWPRLERGNYHLYLGRLHPKKGCDLLLRAFAQVERGSERTLVMAGPGERLYLEELRRMAVELGIADRVMWPGMVTGDAKFALMHCAETFVLPSHQENFAIAAVEALSSSTPLLLSDKVQICSDIRKDNAGIVDEDTLEGVCRQLETWNSLGADEKLAFRLNAHRCYVERFTAVRNMNAATAQIVANLQSNPQKLTVIRAPTVETSRRTA